jgi:hypothetical protein
LSGKKIGKRLDESEVVIVSPIEDNHQLLQDTSHVSVVTVGDEREQVKDSSALNTTSVLDDDKSRKLMNGKVVLDFYVYIMIHYVYDTLVKNI